MEELGEWDRVLLGCAYREPFGNLHHHPPPSPHHRSSDVDFADVFGGPPRRSSFYEGCRSLTDSLESSSAHSRRPPSSGLAAAEKPAFGELSSPAQRRHLEDDFFGDIFPCSDSWSSTPRKLDRNSFPSAPGSRVLSPSRLVFVGRLSLPSQPSVPKLKGEDHPPFSSPTRHAPYRVRSPEAFSKSSQSKRHAASLEVDLPSDDDNMSTSIGLSNDQIGNNDNKVLNDIYMEHKGDAGSTAPEGVLPELDSNYWSRISTGNSGMINNSTEEVSVAILGTKRPELKSVHQHFKDDFDKNGYEQSTRQPEKACGGQRDANSDVKVKKQAQRLNFVAHVDAVCRKMKDIPVYLEDKMHVSRVKGRVKEFIKILNLDGSPKYKDTFEGGDRKPKEKNSVQSKIEVEVSVSTAKTDEEVKFAPSDKEGACAVDFVEVNEILNKGRIPNFYMSSTVPVINDSSSERNDTLGPSSDSTQESIKASVCNIEESHYEDFDECLVEQLSQKQTENQQAGLHQDQIKIANAKIREWSKGKEGNIRSLLSTLQYVLWLESGWKPVPLVDIIEGSSVKKAYQKALLCLHPDKLQQRGAAEHQKYISEKVFDILQHHAPVDGGLVAISNFYTTVLSNEATLAWDQFNSITAF